MKYFYVFLIFCISMSCQLFDSKETLEIFIPDTIPAILEASEYFWQMQYRSFDGEERIIELDCQTQSIKLSVDKGMIQPFILYPVVLLSGSRQLRLLPAGFISKVHNARNKVQKQLYFDWKSGFESELLFRLEKYVDLEKINVARLLASISDVSACENHWIIDSNSIVLNMISGEFRVYDIRKKRDRNITLSLPEGLWFNTNTLGDDILSSGYLIPEAETVFTGLTRYYCQSGLVLEIDMDSDGEYEFIIY